MPRLWPFRSFTNFVITGVLIGGPSFLIYRHSAESKFHGPIVSQAINILNRNQKIKEMLGYPIGYQASGSSQYKLNKGQEYYSFSVVGPRGGTQVQVTASSMLIKDIYQQDGISNKKKYVNKNKQSSSSSPSSPQKTSPLQRIKELQAKISQLNNQRAQSTQQSTQSQQSNKLSNKKKKGWFNFGKSTTSENSSTNNNNNDNDNVNQQIAQLTEKLNKQKLKLIQLRLDYYIPDQDNYNRVMKLSKEDQGSKISAEGTLYKIENMACQLSSRNRIPIIKGGKYLHKDRQILTAKQLLAKQKAGEPLDLFSKEIIENKVLSIKALRQKIVRTISDLSEEELVQYSKNKTVSMYSEFGVYRMYGLLFMILLAGSIYIYMNKNQTTNIKGSVLEMIVQTKFNNHPHVIKIKNKKLLPITFSKQITGGFIGHEFNCKIAIEGLTMGKLEFSGKFIPKTNTYQFDKFYLSYIVENSKLVKVNLDQQTQNQAKNQAKNIFKSKKIQIQNKKSQKI